MKFESLTFLEKQGTVQLYLSAVLMSLNFAFFCGGNPATPIMSYKAKKNKQEEFHLAFICCQIRCAFCLKCSYITAEMPIEGGFSHNTHGHCHPLCPQTGFTPLTWDHLAFSFAHSWIFPSPIKGRAIFAQWFPLQQGQAAWAAKQPPCAVGQLQRWGDPPKWGEHGTTQEWFPLGCGFLPWGLVCAGPHPAHIPDLTARCCAFPMQDTSRKLMLWLFEVTPDLHHHHSRLRDSYRSGTCIWFYMITWVVTRSRIWACIMVSLFW